MKKFFALTLSLVACGGVAQDAGDAAVIADDAQADVAPTVDASAPEVGYPAFLPDAPQVETSGGFVMSSPTVIPIFFQNDPMQSQAEDFLTQLAASSFWGSATSEYGVGPLSVTKSIVVTDAPPVTTDVATIEAWLAGYLDGTHPEWPPLDDNHLYTVFYPAQTTIQDTYLGQSCTSFGGFHYSAKGKAGKSIVYAVLPRCSTFGGSSLTGFDIVSSALSHEIVEASTDALMTNPAYSIIDQDHFVWNFMPLGEVGDMCAYEPQSYQRLVGNYMVQRIWSNKAAKAGHDPCVPQMGAPYFNAVPVLNDKVNISYSNEKIPTQGIQIPLGQSKTIDVKLFSDAPTADWDVIAIDGTFSQNPSDAELGFAWDKQKGHNGDTLKLTITRLKSGSQYGGTEFLLYSERSAELANLWFGFVAN